MKPQKRVASRRWVIFISLCLILLNCLEKGEACWDAKLNTHSIDKIAGASTVRDRALVLFVISFSDFMCLNCIDSFLKLYDSLPSAFQSERTWGILVLDVKSRKKDRDISARIVEKKLRGFVDANDIKFPVFIDRLDIFRALAESGTSVIIFDKREKSAKRYIFPLSGKQIEEIVESLLN